MKQTVYVLVWSWSDGQFGGVVSTYKSEDKAQEMAQLLRIHAESRSYEVVTSDYEVM
jgi:hypothetical protein